MASFLSEIFHWTKRCINKSYTNKRDCNNCGVIDFEDDGGDKSSENWNAFETYLKRIWFSNGIHHHYSNDKIKPGFSSDYLKGILAETNTVLEEDTFKVVFNNEDAKKVNQAKDLS